MFGELGLTQECFSSFLQGHDLHRGKKIRLSFSQTLGTQLFDGGEVSHKFELYESDAKFAPTHPENGKLGYTWTDGGLVCLDTFIVAPCSNASILVKLNCVLKMDFSKVPTKLFTHHKRLSDGKKYVRAPFDLIIEHNQSGLMTFSVEFDGVEHGSVEAMY